MLSRKTGYAILALGHLAKAEGGPLLVKDIARDTGIPEAYLAKLIHALSRKGILHTQRGLGGGVVLNVPPESLSFLHLCQVFDEPLLREPCFLGLDGCSEQDACPLHEFWKHHRELAMEKLQTTSCRDAAVWIAERGWRRRPFRRP